MTSKTVQGENPYNAATPDQRRSAIRFLICILGAALGLRLWGINFGLPYDFTPDEVHEIVRALKLGAGEFSWTPGKGGLYLFLFVEYGFLYVFWLLFGVVDNPTDFAVRYLQDPSAFYLAGRITVAVMGTATCYVLFKIGKRMGDLWMGLMAAAFCATAYYHAMWSHYINVDIGMILAIYLSLLMLMNYEQRKTTRWLLLTGVFAGFAFAFKFTGAVVVVPIALAIATPLSKWKTPWLPIKEGLLVLLAMVMTTSVVAPENIAGIGYVAKNFSVFLESDSGEQIVSEEQAAEMEFDSSVFSITVFRGPDYLSILLRPHNVLFTLLALAGAAVAVRRRYRWDLILLGLSVTFLGVMTLSDRPGEERYLLAIVPVFWLLSARAISEFFNARKPLLIGACTIVIAASLYPLILQNISWTLPDTRVIAKEWVEKNIAPDSKILMDGMRYRFIQSPPLLPNESTVLRRTGGAATEERLSRGVSDKTLQLYEKAMAQVSGPKYDIHSTVWGINVEPLDYYPDNCFDYVIISSQNSRRFASPQQAIDYPVSAAFYQNIANHEEYELAYSIDPTQWKSQGPEIDIYDVKSACE